jgi:hypothetical protein
MLHPGATSTITVASDAAGLKGLLAFVAATLRSADFAWMMKAGASPACRQVTHSKGAFPATFGVRRLAAALQSSA